jgi:hypothetical protein
MAQGGTGREGIMKWYVLFHVVDALGMVLGHLQRLRRLLHAFTPPGQRLRHVWCAFGIKGPSGVSTYLMCAWYASTLSGAF